MEITTYLNDQRQRVEDRLAALMLDPVGDFGKHIEAMRYSLFVGGKHSPHSLPGRGRGGEQRRGHPPTRALPVACALECIHTYSLITTTCRPWTTTTSAGANPPITPCSEGRRHPCRRRVAHLCL